MATQKQLEYVRKHREKIKKLGMKKFEVTTYPELTETIKKYVALVNRAHEKGE